MGGGGGGGGELGERREYDLPFPLIFQFLLVWKALEHTFSFRLRCQVYLSPEMLTPPHLGLRGALYALIFQLSHRDATVFIIYIPNIAGLLRSGHHEPHVSDRQAHKTKQHRGLLHKAANPTSSLQDQRDPRVRVTLHPASQHAD